MTEQSENSGLRALRSAREMIDAFLAGERRNHPLRLARPKLARAEAEMRRLLNVKPIRTRSGHNIRYRIEYVDDEPHLTERRPGGISRPFRVGRDVYIATAQALDTADRPLLFEEVMQGVAERVRPAPPSFQVRTCLRFWTRASKPLVERVRTRYRAVHVGQLGSEVDQLWLRLQDRGTV